MQETKTTSTRTDREALSVLRPDEIDRLTWRPVPTCPGVEFAELWRRGDCVNSLIRYEPDSRTPGYPHLAAYHHLWVVSGSASVAGRYVTAGSYLFIPPGTAHTVTNVGYPGCSILQIYQPTRPECGETTRV